MAIEETQAILTGLEGAACHSSLPQAEQVAPHFFIAELVGRAAVMRGQSAHRLDVDLLRSLSQSGQGHVLDHPHTQWRHGGLLSSKLRRASSARRSKGYVQPATNQATRGPRRSRSVQLRKITANPQFRITGFSPISMRQVIDP